MATLVHSINSCTYPLPLAPLHHREKNSRDINWGMSLDFHKLFESVWRDSSDAVRITDSEGTIVAVNDAYCRLVGMQKEEIVGKPFTVVYDQSLDKSALISRYRERFSDGEVQPLMKRNMRLNTGKTVWVETSNSYIRNHDGAAFLLSIIRDVTDRMQAEEALERERSLLRTIIDNLPDRIFAKDAECRFTLNNQAHIKALGAENQGEVFGKTDFDFRPPELAERLLKDDRRVTLSGERIVEKEEPTVLPNGEAGWLLVTKVPTRDAHGNITGLVGISRNVTAQKFAERALKESEEKYHNLFSNAVQGIFQSTAEGRLVSANSALIKLLGYESIEEIGSLNMADIYADPAQRSALLMMLTEKGACSNVELKLKRKDGSFITVLEHSRVVKDAEGRITMFEGMLEDITERKELEARAQEYLTALQASRESLAELNGQKDRLFSILSHDLRSPFTSILGFCEILLTEGESLSSAERSEFLTHIENSAQRQLALLNKLLDWSRHETGRVKIDVKDIDLAVIAACSVTSHLGSAMKKEIALKSIVPKKTMIRGDEDLMMQVFNNLISNALKFTPTHGSITIGLGEGKSDEWLVSVRDTGAGIPKEDFRKLFRIEEKYTRKGLNGEEGTGLGLSLVAEIVRKHSGSIAVESELGKGTSFTIRFPRLMEDKDQCVLVVDDDEGVRALHSRYIKRMLPDAQVIQATNGRDALEQARQRLPRVIVTDYSMPEMNGFEFLNTLRKDPATKHIPVVVITGKDSTASLEALRLSGASATLTKPVSAALLQESIEKALAEKV